jgi:hypothetical protein
MFKNKKKILYGLIVIGLSFYNSIMAAYICENEVIGFRYDVRNYMTINEKWFSCNYNSILNEQSSLYKSMEHVNWISIEKIHGKGPYCLKTIDGDSCSNNSDNNSNSGAALENPGIVQKLDLWRQRISDYMSAKELRPYYDSQRNPKNSSKDDKYDENRMALLDWLFTTRTKMEECVTGYGTAYKDNLAKKRLFSCQEGITATSAQGYRITPDFPYPVKDDTFNCFPLNAEYLNKDQKISCSANKDLRSGEGSCQVSIEKQSYVDDFYCTSGRQQISK